MARPGRRGARPRACGEGRPPGHQAGEPAPRRRRQPQHRRLRRFSKRRRGDAHRARRGCGDGGYFAREQAAGRGAIAASDRFALAVVAHQLLTGRLPTADRGELAAPVEAVFDRALAEQPERRYPTAAAFVDALGAALASDPAPTAVKATRRRLPPAADDPRRASRPTPLARHTQRSRLWRATAFLFVALAVAAPATAGGVSARPTAGWCAAGAAGASRARDSLRRLAVRGRREPRRLRCRRPPFCRSQAESLSVQGDAWAYRGNTRLLAPDSGNPHGPRPHLRARPRAATAEVYDDLGRKIGTGLCHAYAAAGWELRSQS